MNRVIKVVIIISLRESRKKELKEEIYTRAISLFTERGYENVTIEDITNACGIAKGTFYNYFSRKESILLHLGQRQMDTLENSILHYSGVMPVRERLKLIFKDLLSRLEMKPDLLKAILLKIIRSSLFEQEQQLIIRAKMVLEPVFQEAVAYGEVSDCWSPSQLSAALFGMYYQSIFDWLEKPGQGDLLAVFYRNMDMLWYGIRKEKGEGHE